MQATFTRSSGTEVMSTNWGHTALSYVNPRHVHFILKLKKHNMKPHNINMHKFAIKHLSHSWSPIVVLTPYSDTWSSDQPVV